MNTLLEAGTHPLRGRTAEVSTLREALCTAHRSGGLRISFEGLPGTGKSRLLAEAAALAEEAGLTVLRGLREDADVHDRPVVVLLDDTHCSDESDVRALTRTTLRAAGQPVIWCTTRRWGRPNSPLDIALGSLDLPHRLFRLRPLDEDAIRRMACDLLGAEPDEELARLVSSVSGHPQALRTLLEGLMDECGVDIDVNARLRTACLPEKFKGLVRLRLQDCSPSSTHLLLVASVLGTHLIFGELIEVLGQTASQLLPDIQEAVVSGLLSQDGNDVRFANPLFRRVIRDSMAVSAQVAIREQADAYRGRQFGAALQTPQVGAGATATPEPPRGADGAREPHPSAAAPAARAPGLPGATVTGPAEHAPPTGGAGPAPRVAGWDRLTEKQVVIARLTVQGLTNKETAERLHLSPHTVNYHLRKIFQALSIRSRTDLVRLVHTAVTSDPGPSHRAADTLTTTPTGPGTR
ncbi:helix-turn-helix transcriptional regulator [Streptomyces sp. GMY02]|uniref:helix-turn-helix transcriptional regulator n=1 Tax=Streptomyces sp. GMY02 TaxID=1333528 RepID=UPI002D7E8983|nr:helix-turn-helix transcriptional regulator [Streptomyces sp. GMY02]